MTGSCDGTARRVVAVPAGALGQWLGVCGSLWSHGEAACVTADGSVMTDADCDALHADQTNTVRHQTPDYKHTNIVNASLPHQQTS